MPEEQQVAISVQGVNPPGENSLMGEFSLGKDTGLQTLECLYVFAAAKGVGRSPCLCVLCLSHGNILFCWAFLSMDCQEDDFCTI